MSEGGDGGCPAWFLWRATEVAVRPQLQHGPLTVPPRARPTTLTLSGTGTREHFPDDSCQLSIEGANVWTGMGRGGCYAGEACMPLEDSVAEVFPCPKADGPPMPKGQTSDGPTPKQPVVDRVGLP